MSEAKRLGRGLEALLGPIGRDQAAAAGALRELPVSVRLIREIHAELMRGVRGGRLRPGELRTIQNWMMKEYPRMRTILEQVNYSRTLASKRDFSWLKERETIFLVSRKHTVFLWMSLILPILLGLLSLAALVAPIIQFGATWTWMALAAGMLGLFAALLWGWWNWANWENDYFVVTNWRVLWLEKVIFFYQSRREARLDKVQSNNVTRPFFGRLLDYGSININTYTGKVSMQRVNKPGLIAAYVDGLKERAKVVSSEDENQAIQQELRQAYELHIHQLI